MWSVVLLLRSISPGELPPPRPRACFGRDDLIEKIIALAEHLSPIALIGPGGIGKTSIALTVLHHDRIKKRFGENRRFIRCDQFPASRTHLLSRLSKVVGAGIENPEDLAPLRPFLSSREMILFLDNAESILDPRGTNAQEIYSVVEELSQLENICLCLTSRISTTPPDCKHLDIPTLTMDAACNAFYRVYDSDEQSGLVNNILKQLDFHPLSITLLATVAHHNKWDTDRLSKEWERRRTAMLHTQYNTSLATTIELSLASPMFQELGPDARELLGVAAFFPQGINESNLDWLFPTLSNQTNIFDNFCILSLTYRSNGFFTMLAPLRDYLRPKDPTSSPFLHATKDRYFSRLSTPVSPGKPDFHAARWIGSEDLNVEHLLDVYTSIDPNTADVWDACAHFMQHLYWHKKRLVMLGPKVEGLPDDHPYKPECLFQLSRLFHSVGNYVEYKRLLVQTLGLWRKWGDDLMVAETLGFISNANRWLDLREEGIDQAKETLEIYKRVGHVSGQAVSLHQLGWLLYEDKHLDAAEKAASQAIELLSGGNQFEACECRRLLGLIHRSRGETEKAIEHFETAIGIASPSGWLDPLFWSNYSLAELFFGEGRFEDAHVHIERAKSHATGDRHWLARAMELQAGFWYEECKFEEARTEALGAVDLYESLGATKYLEYCKTILRNSEEKMKTPVASGGNNPNGELLRMVLRLIPANSPMFSSSRYYRTPSH